MSRRKSKGEVLANGEFIAIPLLRESSRSLTRRAYCIPIDFTPLNHIYRTRIDISPFDLYLSSKSIRNQPPTCVFLASRRIVITDVHYGRRSAVRVHISYSSRPGYRGSCYLTAGGRWVSPLYSSTSSNICAATRDHHPRARLGMCLLNLELGEPAGGSNSVALRNDL